MDKIKYIDNSAIKGREDSYVTIAVKVSEVLESWRSSLFSFEWVTPDLEIKKLKDLPERERQRRLLVEEDIRSGKPLEKPILGIGMLDNVEIGSGRAVFLTLASMGAEEITVHVPIIYKDDFEQFTREAG